MNVKASQITQNAEQTLLLRAYNSLVPPYMFLADRTNLESIRDAQFLMFDGTFKYCPEEFYRKYYEVNGQQMQMSGQVYTMHSVYSNLPTQQSSFLSGIF